MKDPNGFDELARHKLAERDFVFDPSHWTDMERLLAERDRKPKAWWPWMAAGVLLVGGAALWAGMNGKGASVPVPNGPVAERVERSTTTAAPVPTAEVPAPAEAPPVAAEPPQVNSASPITGTGVAEAKAPRERMPTAGRNGLARTQTERAHPERVREDVATRFPTNTVDPGSDPATTVTVTGSTLAADLPTLSTTEQGNGSSGSTTAPAPSTVPVTAPSDGSGIKATDGAEQAVSTADPGQQIVTEPVQEPSESTVPTPPEPSTIATDPNTSRTETTPPSTVEPDPAPPAPPAWLAVQTPFELSVLGGAFSTTSTYGGSGTETWEASTERQNNMGFGIEGTWNIGSHFGLGTGAHFSSYQERLLTEELSRTDRILTNSYFWIPYDTLVLTVTGSDTIGATVVYTTELVPMTLYELGHTTDTTYHMTVLRERRTVTNTVNYVEIPLLLDVHTSCGRWVFGVRGGPTFGLLTSKQGSIPGEGETGYTDLNERTFRSMTLGCTGRAYARYRLSSAWSIGLEPTWRQQLGNALGDADVQRRGSAVGGYLSVSYRIAPKSVVP
jgi:hypothetical protein